MPDETEIITIPESFEPVDVNAKLAEYISDTLGKKYPDFTSSAKHYVTDRGSITHTLDFQKGWLDGFSVKLDFKKPRGELSMSVMEQNQAELVTSAVVAFPLILVFYAITASYIRNAYAIENLSFIGHMVSLVVGALVGGMVGGGVAFVLGAVFISKDIKQRNQIRRDDVEELCRVAAREFLSSYVPPRIDKNEEASSQSVPGAVQPEAGVKKEKNSADDKHCARCHAEKKNVMVCEECGHIDWFAAAVAIVLVLAGMGIAVNGLVGLANPNSPWWANALQIACCGLPGMIIAWVALGEARSRKKTAEWAGFHAQEVQRLLDYLGQNPGATPAQVATFMDRDEIWILANLADLEVDGKIRQDDGRFYIQ